LPGAGNDAGLASGSRQNVFDAWCLLDGGIDKLAAALRISPPHENYMTELAAFEARVLEPAGVR